MVLEVRVGLGGQDLLLVQGDPVETQIIMYNYDEQLSTLKLIERYTESIPTSGPMFPSSPGVPAFPWGPFIITTQRYKCAHLVLNVGCFIFK